MIRPAPSGRHGTENADRPIAMAFPLIAPDLGTTGIAPESGGDRMSSLMRKG